MRGLGPAFGFVGEDFGERAEASVPLQFGEPFRGDFIAQDFGEPARLLGGSAIDDDCGQADGFEEARGVAPAEVSTERFER